jgi:hypothetical protein
MPAGRIAVPYFVATRAGRTAEYLIGVFDGGSGATIASVFGGPPGTQFMVETPDPTRPSWQIVRATQNGPPGRYTISVHFNGAVSPLSLTLDVDAVTPVDAGESVIASPAEFDLRLERNPIFGPGVMFLDLPVTARVTLTVFDIAGRRVRILLDGETRGAGQHSLVANLDDLSQGVYFLRMQATPVEGHRMPANTVRKMVVKR